MQSSQSSQSSQSQNPSSLLRRLKSAWCVFSFHGPCIQVVPVEAVMPHMPPILQPSCSLSLSLQGLCGETSYFTDSERSQACFPVGVPRRPSRLSTLLHFPAAFLLKLFTTAEFVQMHMFWGRTVATDLNLTSSGNHCRSPSLPSVKTQMRRTGGEIQATGTGRDEQSKMMQEKMLRFDEIWCSHISRVALAWFDDMMARP